MQVAKEFETILLNDLVKKFNSIFQIPVYLLNRTELTTSHNISNWTVNSQSLSVNTVNSRTNDITSNVSRLTSHVNVCLRCPGVVHRVFHSFS